MYNKINEYCRLLKSASFFHISSLYNSIRYGSVFSFNQIANDNLAQNGVQVEFDENRNIIKFNDGKNTPIAVGSIPRIEEHLDKLKKSFNLSNITEIGIYSLNRAFERNWAGLTALLIKNPKIQLYKYPTIDFEAPSFIDLLRIVRDLRNRDLKLQNLAYIHCKAGKGRSVLSIAAYILTCLNDIKIDATLDQIEYYLKLKRPQISLNSNQKKSFQNFHKELLKTGNFDILLHVYKNQIKDRDCEVINQ